MTDVGKAIDQAITPTMVADVIAGDAGLNKLVVAEIKKALFKKDDWDRALISRILSDTARATVQAAMTPQIEAMLGEPEMQKAIRDALAAALPSVLLNLLTAGLTARYDLMRNEAFKDAEDIIRARLQRAAFT